MKVLLIEDHEGFAAIVREMLLSLRQECVSFEWSNRLDKGIERVIQWKPEVILLDLFLPDSRGLDTLSQVRRYAATAPIIVLTGNDDEKLAGEAIGRGAQDYLVKGEIDRRGFGRAVRYAIERKKTELRLEYHRQRQGVSLSGYPPTIWVTGKRSPVGTWTRKVGDRFGTARHLVW